MEKLFLMGLTIICALFVVLTQMNNKEDIISNTEENENFFGGFYYPYDYPYYYPYFYSGCNENVFGKIKCISPYRGYW